MAKRTTRRTVSMRAETYVRLVEHTREIGIPAAAFVEQVVTRALSNAGAPHVERHEALDVLDMRAQETQHDRRREIEEIERLRREAFG